MDKKSAWFSIMELLTHPIFVIQIYAGEVKIMGWRVITTTE